MNEFNGLNYKQTKTLVKYNKDADKIHQLIAIGKSAYRGGGIIHNITHYYQESKFVNNIDMIDFKSLFPIAGLIASFELNNNIDNYYLDEHTYTHEQATDKIKSLMFDYEHQKINAIILIEGYWKEGSIPLFPQKVGSKNWEDENYKTVYAKNVIFTKRNWVSLFELQQHIKLGFVVTKIHKIYSWKYPKPSERINSLINWFTYLINKKDEAENEGNQGLRYIIKLLLNSSYGKLVEKRVTKDCQ
ncbi:MAG: hypothetical protein KatS3mg003_1074 [Candidatus Nitrosocaldaceae archaeon]|nr:MAG: hypothetical protein KatS3mg003_1074 [Candidatus Nitrosocaldaceae archaeon]